MAGCMVAEVGIAEGKCPKCGMKHQAPRPAGFIVCDCSEYCPICGAKMVDYVPDLTPATYGTDDKNDLLITKVCNNITAHPGKLPFYSKQKPVEVELT